MNREPLSIKTRVKIGVFGGITFALIMAGFDYLNYEPFALQKFIFFMFGFGLAMAFFFGYEYTKDES